MNKPSKTLLELTIDITGERELEEYPKLLKLYTYTLDLEVEIERLNNIIKRLENDLRNMYLTFGEFSEEYTENCIKKLKEGRIDE